MADRESLPPSILVVDDEEPIRRSLRYYFEDHNYIVFEAENGLAGLELFRKKRPDLVLIDLRMPEMDGLEVLSKITKLSPETPVIVISGTGRVNDVAEALHLGAWDYFLKPIQDMSVLIRIVEKSIGRTRSLKRDKENKKQMKEKIRLLAAKMEVSYVELAKTRKLLVHTIKKIAQYKDDETANHCIRVGLFSRILAEGYGLPDDQVNILELCGPLHDIGKVGVPEFILQKISLYDIIEPTVINQYCDFDNKSPELLSGKELEMYRSHTTIGENILTGSDSPLLDTACKIAAHHHEHWDGSGFPYALSHENIPIEARIVGAADIFDILSNEHYYKEKISHETQFKILRHLSGTMLEPQLIDIFFENVDQILGIKEQWKDL